jgi:hypothetical protein
MDSKLQSISTSALLCSTHMHISLHLTAAAAAERALSRCLLSGSQSVLIWRPGQPLQAAPVDSAAHNNNANSKHIAILFVSWAVVMQQ